MVSIGDTENSLHIRAPWNSGGRGYTSDQLISKVPRSAQMFIFGESPDQLISKVPRSAQMFISRPTQTQSAKICPIFIGEGGVIQIISNPKCQDLPKFPLGGGTPDQHSWNTWVGALKEFWTQIHPTAASTCFTDSRRLISVLHMFAWDSHGTGRTWKTQGIYLKQLKYVFTRGIHFQYKRKFYDFKNIGICQGCGIFWAFVANFVLGDNPVMKWYYYSMSPFHRWLQLWGY